MRLRTFFVALLFGIAASRSAWSQDIVIRQAPSGPQRVAVPQGRPATAPPAAARPTPPRPETKTKAGDDKAAKPDASKGKPEDDKPKNIQRPDKPATPADPQELEVTPDQEGLVQFSFRGQAWPDVLEWLAGVSNMSLDWQELPGDYLNLTTRRSYTVEEARDLINRHLLARGFTLLINGEVLSVAKIAEINPGIVPRIHPEELARRMPNEFAKVSFQLEWLLAEQTAEELKPMISPNGKLTPLKNTNRLEAMDSVVNLSEIYAVLQQEQSTEGDVRLIEEFPLLYTRASEVIGQLETLLGLESKKSAAPMTPQQMAAMQQQQARMAQQAAQRGGKQPPQPKKEEAKVNLVANPRKNSILAHAPPDKMAIIKQAVQAIDVQSDRRHSLIANPNRAHVYRLHALDPEALVKTLEELGELDPTTRLDIDSKNKAIIAFASLVDHVTIRQLIDQLDGSSRSFEVIRLRRLAADYVAGTVEFMMVGKKEEQQQGSRYDYYSYRYGQQDKDEGDDDEFRVDADIENNFLLLWASEIEIEEVMNLLVKLGEIPPRGGRQTKVRVLDAIGEQEAARFLERLRQAWPSLAPNRLNLPAAPPKQEKNDDTDSTKQTTDGKEARLQQFRSRPGKGTSGAPDSHLLHNETFTVALVDESAIPADEESQATGDLRTAEDQPDVVDPRRQIPARQTAPADTGALPPIQLTIAPDGRLVITSDDTRALDLLEELITQLAPPRPDYQIFRLKYADAYWVMANLEDYFEEDEEESGSSNMRFYFPYDYAPQSQQEPRYRLSQRKKLKFIYDLDTNSILVQGADPRQLKTIEELIEIYDQPEPADSQSARHSQVFQIQHSKAQTIADTIKDVYRDLLSSNDKALANNPEQKNRAPSTGTTYIYGSGSSSEGSERTQIRFKGKLSIGVDTLSNTLVVSAEGDHLMKNVAQMIETLDEAARPVSTVSVVEVGPGVNAANVSEVLGKLLTDAKPAAEGEQRKPEPQQSQEQQQRRERSRAAGSVLSVAPQP